MTDKTEKKLMGWAHMKAHNPERLAQLASSGGKKSSTNFKNMTPEQRREFGRRGGNAKSARKKDA